MIRPDAPVGGKYSAVVTAVVDRLLDAASGTFGVRLQLPNRGRALPAGIRREASFAGIGDAVPVRPVQSPKLSPKRVPAAPAK